MGDLGTLRDDLRAWTCRNTFQLPDALANDLINAGLELIQHAHDWTGQQGRSADIAYTSTDDGKALPTDFMWELCVSQRDASASAPAQALSAVPKLAGGRDAWLRAVGATSGTTSYELPGFDETFYYLWDEKIFLVPQPSSTVTLVLDYWAKLADLTGSGTNWWTAQAYTLTRWAALTQAFAFFQMYDALGNAEQQFQRALQVAIKRDTAARMSGSPRVRGL